MKKLFIVILLFFEIVLIYSKNYRVKKGDTGYSIARKFGIAYDKLKSVNEGIDFNKLRKGQIIKIPDNTTNADNRNNASISFQKPVIGLRNSKIIETRQPFSIEYSMRFGNVLSSADGEITYAGNISQLGRVIFIKHIEGFTTVYKIFNAVLVVSKGDKVRSGQKIAIGKENLKILFHFFRFNKPINPSGYLR